MGENTTIGDVASSSGQFYKTVNASHAGDSEMSPRLSSVVIARLSSLLTDVSHIPWVFWVRKEV